MSKITGTPDFSGQDSGYPGNSPDEEARHNQDGGTAGLNYQYIPDFSNPGRNSKVTRIQSSDPRVHTDTRAKDGK